jgi:hypothetical protein
MDLLLKLVNCGKCGLPTRHRIAILEEISQLQSELVFDVRYINYACPECNFLARSPLGEAKFFSEVDRRKFPDDLTVSLVSLGCVGKDCESPVILLASVKREMGTEVSVMEAMRLWQNHSAHCAKHFPPKEPLDFRESLMLPR